MIKFYFDYEGKTYHDKKRGYNTLKELNDCFYLKVHECYRNKTTNKIFLKIEYNTKKSNGTCEFKFYLDENNSYSTLYSFVYYNLKNKIERYNKNDNLDYAFSCQNLLNLITANESDSKRLYKHQFIHNDIDEGITILHTIEDRYQYSFDNLVSICNNLSNKIEVGEISWILTNYTLEFLIDFFHAKR